MFLLYILVVAVKVSSCTHNIIERDERMEALKVVHAHRAVNGEGTEHAVETVAERFVLLAVRG